MNKLYRIGITGPTGAGKGAVSALFTSLYGVPSLDADKIYHRILEENEGCKRELAESFGGHILKDGKIDRRALAAVVFADGAKEKLLLLNSITHRYVIDETERLISCLEAQGAGYAIIDAPLLIEAGMDKDCDTVISVLASTDTRLERIISRDGITREAALARISKQKDDCFYTDAADFTVYNDTTLEELAESVRRIAASIGIAEEKGKK